MDDPWLNHRNNLSLTIHGAGKWTPPSHHQAWPPSEEESMPLCWRLTPCVGWTLDGTQLEKSKRMSWQMIHRRFGHLESYYLVRNAQHTSGGQEALQWITEEQIDASSGAPFSITSSSRPVHDEKGKITGQSSILMVWIKDQGGNLQHHNVEIFGEACAMLSFDLARLA